MSQKQLLDYVQKTCGVAPEIAKQVFDATTTYIAIHCAHSGQVEIEGFGQFSMDEESESGLMRYVSDVAMDNYIRIQRETSGDLSEGDEDTTIKCKKTQRCPSPETPVY